MHSCFLGMIIRSTKWYFYWWSLENMRFWHHSVLLMRWVFHSLMRLAVGDNSTLCSMYKSVDRQSCILPLFVSLSSSSKLIHIDFLYIYIIFKKIKPIFVSAYHVFCYMVIKIEIGWGQIIDIWLSKYELLKLLLCSQN